MAEMMDDVINQMCKRNGFVNPRKRQQEDDDLQLKQKQRKHQLENVVAVSNGESTKCVPTEEVEAGPMSACQSELDIDSLDEVLELLETSRFSEQNWLNLGLKFGLLKNTLETIEAKHRPDINRCLIECLTLWLRRVDKVDEKGVPTWDTLADTLSKLGEKKSAENARQKGNDGPTEEFSSSACQMLQKYTDRLSHLVLSVEIVQMLYTERVISKETLDEVNSLGGKLGDGPLRAICATVYEDPNKLRVLASIFLKFEQTVSIGQDILKNGTFSSQVILQETYQQDFDKMRVAFGNLIYTVGPLIEAGIPSLDELKEYVQTCFPELTPQLTTAESFDNAIVDHYKITEAKQHIDEFNTAVDTFCENTRADICCNQSFSIFSSSHHLICDTIEFVLDWDADKCTLKDIKLLLLKAFKGFAKFIQVRAIAEGHSILVTCHTPQYMMESLLIMAEENLNLLKHEGLIRLTFGYYTIFDKRKKDKDIQALEEDKQRIVEDLTHKVNSQDNAIKEKTKEIRDLKSKLTHKCNQEDELKQLLKAKTKMNNAKSLEIEQLKATEKKLLCVSDENQKEIETLQEIVTSLTLQLRERDQQIKGLKESLKDVLSKVRKPISFDQGLPETLNMPSQQDNPSEQIESLISELRDQLTDSADDKQSDEETNEEDPRSIQWGYNYVDLSSATTKQADDVMNHLKTEQTGKDWSIRLITSSPESALVVINNLNECIMRAFYIDQTPLDSTCVSALSEILKANRTMKRIYFISSPLTGGIKPLTDALCVNRSIDRLEILHNAITDEDMTHVAEMFCSNKTLKEVVLSDCDITDNGFGHICEGLTKNQTLIKLNVGNNTQITTISTSTIVKLMNTTTSLIELYLQNTSLEDDDIMTICHTLPTNKTIERIVLSKKYKESCDKLEENIQDRLLFL